jgi:two-component system, NarL family, response regulator NreC
VKILLADDHVMFRHSLRGLLESAGFIVIGEATNGVEALKMVHDYSPDVLVLDINMPLQNGLEVARTLCRRRAPTKVVMLSMHQDENSFFEAFHAGARAYVLKTQASADLIRALNEVEKGHMYLSPLVSGTLVDAYLKLEDDGVRLSLRERQILQLVAEGTITREIATLLNLSVKSVESHRSQLMRKLNVGSIAGLVRHAVRMSVIRI